MPPYEGTDLFKPLLPCGSPWQQDVDKDIGLMDVWTCRQVFVLVSDKLRNMKASKQANKNGTEDVAQLIEGLPGI